MNLHSTYETRDTLKSLTLFITFKAIAKLNLGHRDEFEIDFKKLAVAVHVLQTTQNFVISRCCFAENGKEMYKELKPSQTRTHCCGHIVAHDVSWARDTK